MKHAQLSLTRPEPYNAAIAWLAANGHETAALTGGSARLILAIDACWRAYSVASDRLGIVRAVAELVRTLDARFWPMAIELVARHLDWGDRVDVRDQLRTQGLTIPLGGAS